MIEEQQNELLTTIDKKHWHLFNFNWQDQSPEAIEFRKAVLANTNTLKAVVEWAIEKANQEIEPYDDISYGEAYAAQKVYELIKDKLK